MAVVEDSCMEMMMMIDEDYEYDAPQFFDFINDETEEDVRRAEIWFQTALAYAPSPFTAKIKMERTMTMETLCDFNQADESDPIQKSEPVLARNSKKTPINLKKEVEKITSSIKKCRITSNQKPKSVQSSKKNLKPDSVKRDKQVKKTENARNLTQENQAIKRQKLEGGRSRQILNIKPLHLQHKTQLATEKFVSMAEMMKKFESGTRNLSFPRTNQISSTDASSSSIQRKTKLTLTRPHEPELETMNRVRSIRVKSSAEIEEEMMAKIPKFRARPLNKKILEAPTMAALQRSIPQPPEFHEFRLETMARNRSSHQEQEEANNHQDKPKLHLAESRTPVLHTSLRARPVKIKSTAELEIEEIQNAPKFKALPLNKKILESKGELGVLFNTKRNVTVPEEFHFATDERIPPPISTDSRSVLHQHDCKILKNTRPDPFFLYTEERGAEKERRFVEEVMQKQSEEEKARIPKANPYPYTTDYPVIPSKPDPKECTKPEPFQLESIARHEDDLRREMEERERREKEAARMRIFKAQPILKEEPPVHASDRLRKPLTQVQEFNLHVEQRAADRAEFDRKVKEKETIYKRYREESESMRLMEEEKALKQLRRTMVPHARPVPNFDKPFLPLKSTKETTKARSPHLLVFQRRGGGRKTGTLMKSAASSSPAAQMR